MFKNAAKFGAGIFAIAFLLLSAAGPVRAAQADTDAQILHLLNRVSFGPVPGDIDAVRRMGMEGYLQGQLHPGDIADPQALRERLSQLSTLNATMIDIVREYGPPPGGKKELTPEQKKEMNHKARLLVEELAQAKILRAIASPAQLQEVMTDFWFNHFNVFFGKGAVRYFLTSYERDAIRPYALGKFRTLLEATARHPAMLFYLDNWENTDPNSPIGQKAARRVNKKLGINENYGRELMELHTLGVDGGYTQADVTTLAHILTGWGVARGPGFESKTVFQFEADRHDPTNKIFLGRPFQGGGVDEVERALDILAYNPSTAHHIALQLAQYFVADNPPASLVAKLQDTFLQSGGDIAETLNTLFHSQEFWDPKYFQVKFKPPFRFVVSTLRANGIMPPGDTRALQKTMAQMGEPLYLCVTPNGYANTNSQWLNSDAVLKRIDFSTVLPKFTGGSSAQTIEATLGSNWSAKTLNTVKGADAKTQPALLLGSPEFLYY